MKKTKILMVCLGNICRSPLAEGILRSKISGETITVDSAGTAAYHIGETPDPRSVSIAQKHNIDISNQRGRKFQVSDFDNFDYIYVMDNSNYKNVVNMARNTEEEQKVDLILNLTYPGKNMDVPDPYYGGPQGFENVYNMLDRACKVLAEKLKNNTPG
ncbi:low molecular weight protein-tyrosine-phosphatase [Sinomicrobium weinanense]|uniref:protein-tyrosine-phosphatase n=1 Tax=Sinomicrobium weinanense TaxID=2842200 RepID=A0A926JTQ2_9FLAO|nr:low molecular weight protein-tyrosine-phosphatase [Sinomicrobium weinanense]MBC9797067.1 low molecular weight phosphotyrosine protein phosphatase [Sinomicrobium weinanense]MBU3122704.1 low molecular weight phosphotyrosine protein phosphatase [Sinomicrobium weinanense]